MRGVSFTGVSDGGDFIEADGQPACGRFDAIDFVHLRFLDADMAAATAIWWALRLPNFFTFFLYLGPRCNSEMFRLMFRREVPFASGIKSLITEMSVAYLLGDIKSNVQAMQETILRKPK